MDIILKFIPTFSTFSGLLVFLMLFLFFSSWVKISTVFGILQVGLGFTGIPSLLILSGLSFVLTIFVMYPTLQNLSGQVDQKMKAYNVGSFENLQTNQKRELLDTVSVSWLAFLQKNTDRIDLERFASLTSESSVTAESLQTWRVVAPAFIVSELKKAFSIAFSLFLPFLLIDLIIATILAAVELNNLELRLVSLPFKLLLFVLVDGWGLVATNLIRSYTS